MTNEIGLPREVKRMAHFNIQIHIQRVDEREVNRPGSIGRGASVDTERQVTEVLKLAVTATSEQEAYAKAHRMLTANESADE